MKTSLYGWAMKKLVLLIIIFPTLLRAASTVAHPFDLIFTIPKDQIFIKANLVQNCRHEKFVIGDTAEYVDNFVDYELDVTYEDINNDVQEVVVSLTESKHLYIDGFFKPNKECMSQVSIILNDTKYAIGWADRFNDPVSFQVSTDFYNYSETNVLDVSYLKDILHKNHMSFFYKPVPSYRVNVWLYANGSEVYEVPPTSAAFDPKTKMPYPLKD